MWSRAQYPALLCVWSIICIPLCFKELQVTKECREWEEYSPGKSSAIGLPIPNISHENVHASNIIQTNQVAFVYLGIYVLGIHMYRYIDIHIYVCMCVATIKTLLLRENLKQSCDLEGGEERGK